MGNRQPVERHVAHPKCFYLVVGGPPIRYVGANASRGPLIFDVETEAISDENAVEHAETVNLQVAIPSKQMFKLVPVNVANKKSGFLLSFSVSIVEPGQTLRVLAGVDIDYRPGEGVMLMQAERSQNPFCVYEAASSGDFGEEVVVDEVLYLQKLKKAVFTEGAEGKRLTYAPIAIELTFETPTGTASTTENSTAAAEMAAGEERREGSAKMMEDSNLASSSEIMRVVQYTFLDIPDAAHDRATLTSLLHEGAGEGGERPVCEAKVVRQLLQYGTEVYELDDVFDLGACDDLSGSNAESEDDAGLCVVCLTNAKDTTLLPCRHMCLCYECASVLRFQQSNRCPICRASIERVMTI
ncbi:zinc finger family protein [Trypanosoma grayi]|uniref:zinc finger family protein n=1 Tax=Trypanosoma grayi TaxID=71804 RepID=UPI0004F43A1B|nr:zinc finger family protein [Trypanosoma grayi]KEG10778.1 zinc finger family protein [Trypanosoma grayi]